MNGICVNAYILYYFYIILNQRILKMGCRIFGVDVFGLVEDQKTHYRWSGDKVIKNLFGEALGAFTYYMPIVFEDKEKTSGLVSVGLAYNQNNPSEVYPYYVVDWSEEQWMQARRLADQLSLTGDIKSNRDKAAIAIGAESGDEDALKATVLEMLKDDAYRGRINLVLRDSGVPKKVYDKWVLNDTVFRERLDLISQCVLDQVELRMLEAIENHEPGNVSLIKYVLNTHASDRGYGSDEKPTTPDAPMTLNYSALDNDQLEQFTKLIQLMQPEES